ncbi:MAG: MFS transporter, partial [Gemmatimonadales bacterium]
LTTTLGAGAAALGALDGAADFASSVVKYRAGRLADRPARRGPLIVAGYAIAVLVRPVIALAGAAWQVIGLRVADRLGKGVRTPPRDALIADATPLELRGRAFGLQRGLDHVGAVLGPLTAWLLLTNGWSLRGVIGASLIPGILVLALAVWAVKDGGGRRGTERDGEGPGATPSVPLRPSPSLSVFFIASFYLLRMPEALVILWAQHLGVPVVQVTLLWAALHVVKSGTSFWGGALADRLGPERTLALGWTSYGLVAAACIAASALWHAWTLFLLLGVVAGLTESPERALVARVAGAQQGTGFGRYHAATGLAALAGGLALGATFQHWGAGPAFGASAAAGLVLALTWTVTVGGGR